MTVLLVSCVVERPWDTLPPSAYFSSLNTALITVVAISLGGLLAFLMLMSEFQVIVLTSAMTFQVAGCLKEVVTICIAVLLFEDVITPLNGVGLGLVILGSLLYKLSRSISGHGAGGTGERPPVQHSNSNNGGMGLGGAGSGQTRERGESEVQPLNVTASVMPVSGPGRERNNAMISLSVAP